MIVKGGSRRNVAFFSRHLTRTDHNERVAVIELRGLAAQNVRAALHEMQAIASGTRVKNFLYHANLNPRDDEHLTSEQWHQAADILERHLGLTDQPRIVVEHVKEGRTHRHIIWSRIEADTLRAVSDSLVYAKHEQAAREIEQRFGHPPVPSVLVKDRGTPRPPRRPSDRESFRGAESGRSPQDITAEITALWHTTDSGQAFAAALRAHGYILARGDRRDFVIVDGVGDDHSLARRIAGVKAAAIRTRMADIDREALPSVAEGRAMARQSNAGGSASGTQEVPKTEPVADAFTHTVPRSRPASATSERRGKGRSDPPRDAVEAAAQVRAVAAQYTRPSVRRPPAFPMPRVRLPRGTTAPADAAAASRQLRAAVLPFLHAILRHGSVPQIIVGLIVTGLTWWQHAAHYLAGQSEEAHGEAGGSWQGYLCTESPRGRT